MKHHIYWGGALLLMVVAVAAFSGSDFFKATFAPFSSSKPTPDLATAMVVSAAMEKSTDVCDSDLISSSTSYVYCFSVSVSDSITPNVFNLSELTFNINPKSLNLDALAEEDGWLLYSYNKATSVVDDVRAIATGTWSSGSKNVTLSTTSTMYTYSGLPDPSILSTGTKVYYVLTAPIELETSTETSSLTVYLAEIVGTKLSGDAVTVHGLPTTSFTKTE